MKRRPSSLLISRRTIFVQSGASRSIVIESLRLFRPLYSPLCHPHPTLHPPSPSFGVPSFAEAPKIRCSAAAIVRFARAFAEGRRAASRARAFAERKGLLRSWMQRATLGRSEQVRRIRGRSRKENARRGRRGYTAA